MGGRLQTTEPFRAEEQYFEWLSGMIPEWRHSHSCLLRQLFETPFVWILEMDANRASDGLALRTRFCWEARLDMGVRDELKAARPCSVLEVMIAMAIRCEEEFMTEYAENETLDRWIGPMLCSMGVDREADETYDREAVQIAVDCMMRRDYAPDGQGSLFDIPGCREDLREIELWEQMMIWIESRP